MDSTSAVSTLDIALEAHELRRQGEIDGDVCRPLSRKDNRRVEKRLEHPHAILDNEGI